MITCILTFVYVLVCECDTCELAITEDRDKKGKCSVHGTCMSSVIALKSVFSPLMLVGLEVCLIELAESHHSDSHWCMRLLTMTFGC